MFRKILILIVMVCLVFVYTATPASATGCPPGVPSGDTYVDSKGANQKTLAYVQNPWNDYYNICALKEILGEEATVIVTDPNPANEWLVYKFYDIEVDGSHLRLNRLDIRSSDIFPLKLTLVLEKINDTQVYIIKGRNLPTLNPTATPVSTPTK